MLSEQAGEVVPRDGGGGTRPTSNRGSSNSSPVGVMCDITLAAVIASRLGLLRRGRGDRHQPVGVVDADVDAGDHAADRAVAGERGVDADRDGRVVADADDDLRRVGDQRRAGGDALRWPEREAVDRARGPARVVGGEQRPLVAVLVLLQRGVIRPG